MTASPALRSDFFDRLAEAISRYPHDEFAIHQVRREAENLRKRDPMFANEILGAVASIQGDAAKTAHLFEMALAQPSADDQTFTNYLVSLCVLQDNAALIAAIEKFGPAWMRRSSHAAMAAVNILLEAGYPIRAAETYMKFPEFSEQIDSLTGIGLWAKDVGQVLAAYGLSESDIESAVVAGRSTLARNGVRRSAGRVSVIPDVSVGRPSILYQLSVDTSAEGAADLESRVFDSYCADNFPAIDSGMLTVMVRCARETHDVAAA